MMLAYRSAPFMAVLGIKRAAAKIVPKLQNFGHRSENVDDPDLLKKIITGNESWMYGYDIEIKAQISQWKRLEMNQYRKKHVTFGQM